MQLLAGVPYFRTWPAQPQEAFHRGWKITEVRAVSRSFPSLRDFGSRTGATRDSRDHRHDGRSWALGIAAAL